MKRIVDVLLAVPALILLLPAMILVAIVVKFDSAGPALYRGKRIGRFGQAFYLLKFRTMVTNADTVGPLVTGSGDPRITRCGRLLRRTKIDEFPSLWNVVKGEMSLVGPRPENELSVSLYTAEQRQILSLQPGITSLATLKYRHEEELLKSGQDLEETYYKIMQDKLNLELEYLRTQNLWLDLRILVQTVLAVFR